MTASRPNDTPPETIAVYREMDHIVIEGDDWQLPIPLAQVATDDGLRGTLDDLRTHAWMTDAVRDQVHAEALWLRRQLPPGK